MENVSETRLSHAKFKMPTPAQIVDAIEVIVGVVRNIALKRALAEVEPDPHLNFWRVMHGNAMDMAVLEWCKLFGLDGDVQSVHWKAVFDDHDAFRDGLLQHLGLDGASWRDYWTEMRTYRDQYVAHLDAKRAADAYPELGTALASATFYYQELLSLLRAEGIERYPSDLADYYEQFRVQALDVATRATGATRGIEERVR